MLKSSDYNGIYPDMVEQLGEEIVVEINKHYKGQQVTFPMRLYSKNYVIRYIKENYNGNNIKNISRELGYSQRWIQDLINRNNINIK